MNQNPEVGLALACISLKRYLFLTSTGAVLTIAQIIKFLMSSAAEAELVSLFINARKCAELRQTLIEMGWPQYPTPMQVDNASSRSRHKQRDT